MLDAALAYAARGWPVFPCVPGLKVPVKNSHGVDDATTDTEQIIRWWTARPDCNVAIATGTASGIYVLDFDVNSPLKKALPPTFVVRTPSGGTHHYFKNIPGLPNSASKITAGLDTRGEGGYVLAPPSFITRPEDESGPYLIEEENEYADLPDFIIAIMKKAEPPPQRKVMDVLVPPSDHYAAKALDDECARVCNAAEGTRNDTLNRAAFSLGTLVGAHALEEEQVRAALYAAAMAAGLEDAETHATIRSGLTSGIKSPRQLPERRTRTVVEVQQPDGAPPRIEVTEPAPDDGTEAMQRDADREAVVQRVVNLGGLCDSFLTWVLETAQYPQPMLSLGALLALGSVIGARRWVMDGLTTTSYVVNLGGTGDGKRYPQSCMQQSIQAGWPALFAASDFSSTVATVEMVSKAAEGGHGALFSIDEYGPTLKTLLSDHGHQSGVRKFLLENATMGTGTYHHAKSLTRGGGTIAIHAPALCLFGSSANESFHSALTSAAVTDGFLGRHLFFQAREWMPSYRRSSHTPVPSAVKTAIESFRSGCDAWRRSVLMRHCLYEAEPVECGSVLDIADDYQRGMDDLRRRGQDVDGVPAPVLARAAEHAKRTAMILALLSQPGEAAPECLPVHFDVARELVEGSLRSLARSLNRHAAETDHERARKAVLHVLESAGGDGWLSRRDMLRRVSGGLKLRDVQEVLERLQIEERIEAREDIPSSGGRPRAFIRLCRQG
jgi:hypothetical protein